jgi:hypothetical protein
VITHVRAARREEPKVLGLIVVSHSVVVVHRLDPDHEIASEQALHRESAPPNVAIRVCVRMVGPLDENVALRVREFLPAPRLSAGLRSSSAIAPAVPKFAARIPEGALIEHGADGLANVLESVSDGLRHSSQINVTRSFPIPFDRPKEVRSWTT